MLRLKVALLAIVSALLLAATDIAGAQQPPVCDRTPQVRDAIVAAISGVTECAAVTAANLSAITALDLSGALVDGATTTPLQSGDFAGLTGVSSLSLNNNQLTELPEDIFDGLTALSTLNLSGNQLSSLPADIFAGLGALADLYLQNNRITSLPDGLFEGLTALSDVNITQNTDDRIFFFYPQLAQATDGNGAVVRVRQGTPVDIILTINVDDDSVDAFAVTLEAGNTTLELSEAFLRDERGVPPDQTVTLTLRETELDFVTKGFLILVDAGESVSVTVVAPPPEPPVCDRTPQVRDAIVEAVSGVTECAAVIAAHLSEITSLDLSGALVDGATTTPLQSGDFADLTALSTLNLSNNRLSSLPTDVFDGLAELITLYLSGNELAELHEDIFDGLSDLDDLYLNNNQLTTLPEDLFDGLTAMYFLDLDNNRLSSLPEDIFDGLPLEELDLGNNHLTELPRDIFEGTLLVELDLSHNRLMSLPQGLFDTLQNANSFQTLNLSHNRLTTLPEGLFDGLENSFDFWFLHLDNNELVDLPAGIFKGLNNLSDLYLSDNELTELPGGIFNGLGNLDELHLNNNQLMSLPSGLFEGLELLQYVYLEQTDGTTFQLNVELIRATGGNGTFLHIREGTPADIILVLTVSVEDDSVDDFNIESVFAAGNTIQELSGALLRDGDEPGEGVAAGKTVTVTLAADESVDLEIGDFDTMEGFDIVAAQQSISITVPAEGDTVAFPFAVDANSDGSVNASDALILYYAYSLRSSLGTGR